MKAIDDICEDLTIPTFDHTAIKKFPRILVICHNLFLYKRTSNLLSTGQISDSVVAQCSAKYDKVIVVYRDEDIKNYKFPSNFEITQDLLFAGQKIAKLMDMPQHTSLGELIIKSEWTTSGSMFVYSDDYSSSGIKMDRELSVQEKFLEKANCPDEDW